MLGHSLVVATAVAYLLLLFGLAWAADRRADAGRSVIGNAWVYTLSWGVYCTAWTYFGSVGRAASAGMWFLPIYLGPTLGLILSTLVVRKMVRIAKTYRITSIADFIASRYGKSPALAGLVTLITVVGIVPYTALQLKAVSSGYEMLTSAAGVTPSMGPTWWQDSALVVALLLAGFTMMFGTRHLDSTERHEGMVAAMAFESVVKLVAFLAVGVYVTWGLFDGPSDIFARAQAVPALQQLTRLSPGASGPRFAYDQWFALLLLAMLSVIFLPRQFQVMVLENVDESHLRRASWAFPLYMLLINLFVLPIALGGLLLGGTVAQADSFVLALPLHHAHPMLALLVFVGGLSAATGMVIMETTAVSTMVCNDLVMPWLLRTHRFGARAGTDMTGLLQGIRRAAIGLMLLLGYAYFRLAGEAYALVSIGLISFAAVAQFAPALLGGMYWKGGTRRGAMAGLLVGFAMWLYTLLWPSLAKSGWLSRSFMLNGPWDVAWLRPEQLLGLSGMDPLTHSLFWSLLLNIAAYVGLSLWRQPSAREISQALLFVDVFERTSGSGPVEAPVFWRGKARVSDLQALLARFVGVGRAQALLAQMVDTTAVGRGGEALADARLVQFVETQLAGAIGSASARVMVARVVQEDTLDLDDVMRILDEASQVRAYAQALEEKSTSLERATAELRQANEQLKSLDGLKDDFMSSVTHELRTPLTSIRALSELMVDDPEMDAAQRQQFLGIVVAETERLSRLVNQVLDMAKIESGQGEWRTGPVDLVDLVHRAAQTTRELFRERGARLDLQVPAQVPAFAGDDDRLMQVLLNLLSNAVKFVPAGQGLVTLRLQADAKGLTVTVQDNGPGVPADQQALVFEKFRQGGPSDHRPQGTGLGLPISRQIVAHYGGTLWLQSQAGQGATFGFDLPWPQPPTSPAFDAGAQP